MEIQEINNIANDIAVQRSLADQYKQELEEFLKLPKIVELEKKIKEASMEKTKLQQQLLEVMKENNLKSWKTEEANFARSTRYSVSIDPSYKKEIENKLKEGEEIENFELKTTEFISIRAVK